MKNEENIEIAIEAYFAHVELVYALSCFVVISSVIFQLDYIS